MWYKASETRSAKVKVAGGFHLGKGGPASYPLGRAAFLALLRHEEVSHVLGRRPEFFIVKVRGAASGKADVSDDERIAKVSPLPCSSPYP